MTTHEVLASLPLFSRLSPDELERVATGTRRTRLGRGQVLFRMGDPCDAFFAVVSGQMTLTLSTADGGEKVLEIISPGETFGEAVMFAGRPYPVTAAALLATDLLVIPAAVVLRLVETDPMFARHMLAGMAVRLHTMINDVEAISLRSGKQRVAGLLLDLAGDDPARGQVVTLPAGKGVMASRLNLTAETFSRTLRDLTAAGLISVSGGRIGLLDLDRLAAVVSDA